MVMVMPRLYFVVVLLSFGCSTVFGSQAANTHAVPLPFASRVKPWLVPASMTTTKTTATPISRTSHCRQTAAPFCLQQQQQQQQQQNLQHLQLRSPLSKLLWLRGGSSSSYAFTRSPPQEVPGPQQQSQHLFPTQASESTADDEETREILSSFLTRNSRNTFIARVYAILAGQLLVTTASICWFGLNPGATRWILTRQLGAALPLGSLILSTVAWYIMCASASARRQSPLKWNLLAIFTLGEALSVGFLSSFYKFSSVVSALLATAGATLAVSVYTVSQRNPKYDLSQWGAGLSACGMVFLGFGLIQLLQVTGVLPAGFLPLSDMVLSLAGAALFSFYLAYHTRLIVAGEHTKFQMSEKDYVFGAMTLYNDIINIFIYILKILGEDRDH